MKDLFTVTALKCSQIITRQYSTSFSLGIRTLDSRFRNPVYAIYGFVRYADEIVDTFHEYNKHELIARFKEDTYRSIEERVSLNPVLHSFQLTVNQYDIDKELIEAFFRSMEMDLNKNRYDSSGYETYIYGSAEVVGLMCLKVFCEGNSEMYQQLREPARKLGSAFQKVNFLRDVKSDFNHLGRIYFPGVEYSSFTDHQKKMIEKDIEKDFREALPGIYSLPPGARRGVYLAYRYYFLLFKKIKGLPVSRIMSERIRIPDLKKLILLIRIMMLNPSKSS